MPDGEDTHHHHHHQMLPNARLLENEDLVPTKLEERTWHLKDFAALWVGMCVCIPTYMLSSALIAGGMSWWQALLTIALGNTIGNNNHNHSRRYHHQPPPPLQCCFLWC